MERGDIPFGKWRSQTLNLYLLDEKKAFANGSIGIFYDGNKTSVQYNSRTLQDNRIKITLLGGTPYLPKIRVENQIELCGKYSQMYKLSNGRIYYYNLWDHIIMFLHYFPSVESIRNRKYQSEFQYGINGCSRMFWTSV